MPLQTSERASFCGDPAIANALELANTSPARIGTRAPSAREYDEEYVVVDLGEDLPAPQAPQAGRLNGEGSDLKKPNPEYDNVGNDMELGLKGEGKHVSNSSKDDAADGEAACRVCHLGFSSGNSERIELGCACKQDLGLCHRDCAEEWFKIRGNTVCEICGETVKNVRIPEPVNSTASRLEADGADAQTHREFVRSTAMSRLRYMWANQLIRNSLLASMIVVFMIPWFFRIAYF